MLYNSRSITWLQAKQSLCFRYRITDILNRCPNYVIYYYFQPLLSHCWAKSPSCHLIASQCSVGWLYLFFYFHRIFFIVNIIHHRQNRDILNKYLQCPTNIFPDRNRTCNMLFNDLRPLFFRGRHIYICDRCSRMETLVTCFSQSQCNINLLLA